MWSVEFIENISDVVHGPMAFCYTSNKQGRRHGFISGGQILRAKRAENFFDPHFLASGGQNIA